MRTFTPVLILVIALLEKKPGSRRNLLNIYKGATFKSVFRRKLDVKIDS